MLGLALILSLSGCDYSPPVAPPVSSTGVLGPQASLPEIGAPGGAQLPQPALNEEEKSQKSAILDNVVNLIQTASIKPGGPNFQYAVQNLNKYFEGTVAPNEYLLSSEDRGYLENQIPAGEIPSLERSAWQLSDARHLEDCMMYHIIATRVAGVGDPLTQVRRLFDWTIAQVELVPSASLAAPGLGQAQARPYDVLLRGMATEEGGTWAERAWVFMSICRQLGIDVGLITYTPPNLKEPVVWTCAALIDKKLYLFDTRIGLPIPSADGQGVATLEEALTDPVVLDRLDIPGRSRYGTTRGALLASPSKIGILIDSSPGYLAPRMRILEGRLAGKYRTILYRDPVEENAAFAEAMGPRFGGTKLWDLPRNVYNLLFTSAEFVQASQHALLLFRSNFPLVYARVKQLRGETADAISDYVSFRVEDHLIDLLNPDPKKNALPREIADALHVYGTYYLALAHLDQNNVRLAEPMFLAILKSVPEPGANQPYINMFRWGAETNLGRICEAQGDSRRAIAYYTMPNPTAQGHGNLIRARELVWNDPMSPLPEPLPPAPTPAPAPAQLGPVGQGIPGVPNLLNPAAAVPVSQRPAAASKPGP
jgi:hypothetical protein